MHAVPRVPPFDRPATYDDLVGLPDGIVAEIIDGELHASPCPAPLVAAAAVTLGRMLFRPPGRDEDPGGWQILPEPELHLGADILVPRLAGWRGSRLRDLPGTSYFSLPPDWVCELQSSGTASFRARKMAIYAGEGVSHAWLIDPDAKRSKRGASRTAGGRAWRPAPAARSCAWSRSRPSISLSRCSGAISRPPSAAGPTPPQPTPGPSPI